MAQSPEQLTEQLAKVTARLEALAKRQRGGGPLSGFKPFLLGGLVGAGAALLYAPQTGEQTRMLLRRNAGELQESATQGAQTAKDKIQSTTAAAQDATQTTLAQVSDKVNATAQNGRAKTNEIVQDTKQTVQESNEKVQQAVEDGGAKVQAAADTAADKTATAQEKTPPPRSA